MFRIIPHRALIVPKATVAGVRVEGDTSKATLRIDGLLCSACASNVRQGLVSVDGVREATVDLERGEAQVTYDASRTTPDDLVSAVEGKVILWPLRRLLARFGRARHKELEGAGR